MGRAARWLVAVAAGVVVFEGLDALAAGAPAVAWLPLVSPFIAGVVAGGGAGGGAVSRLLASAATAWGRIAADRAIGVLHGVRQPLEVELAVAVIFGLPWMGMAVAGGMGVLLVWRRCAKAVRRA
jgi:hypothetical protein